MELQATEMTLWPLKMFNSFKQVECCKSQMIVPSGMGIPCSWLSMLSSKNLNRGLDLAIKNELKNIVIVRIFTTIWAFSLWSHCPKMCLVSWVCLHPSMSFWIFCPTFFQQKFFCTKSYCSEFFMGMNSDLLSILWFWSTAQMSISYYWISKVCTSWCSFWHRNNQTGYFSKPLL